MKIRQCFVSNSSSSSFIIMGISTDIGSFEEKMREKFPDLNYEDDYYEWLEEIFPWKKDDKRTELEWHFPDYYDTLYIGLSVFKMKDDETIPKFMERTKKEFKDFLGMDTEVGWQEECWRDG